MLNLKMTLRQIKGARSGPWLMALLHKAGAHVIVGNSPRPSVYSRQPWYALVEDQVGDSEEFYADGATPWSALRKAALAWARARA